MYPCPFQFVFEVIISNNRCRLDSPCRKVKRYWIASKEKECRFQNGTWSSYSTIVCWIGCGSSEPSQLVHYLYQVQSCLHKRHSISTQNKDICLLLQLSLLLLNDSWLFSLCCLHCHVDAADSECCPYFNPSHFMFGFSSSQPTVSLESDI